MILEMNNIKKVVVFSKVFFKNNYEVVFLFLYSFFIISFNLADVNLIGDEAIYSQVARESLYRGSVIDLYWGGGLWFEKPPLLIWLTMLSFYIFGISEVAAHIFPIIFSVVGVMLVYFLTKKLFISRIAGFIAGFMLVSAPPYIWFSRMNMMDVPLGVCVGIATYSIWRIIKGDEKWFYLVGIFVGLGVMIKGIIGFLPIIIFVSFALFKKRLKVFKSVYFLHSIFLAMFIILPWHIIMTIRHGYIFWDSYFGYHVLGRFTNDISGQVNSGYNIFYYVFAFLEKIGVWEIIFLVLIILFFLISFNNLKKYKSEFSFLFIWSALIFLLFSFSNTRYLHYILPIFFPLACFMGGAFYIIFKKKTFFIVFPSSLVLLNFFGSFYIKKSGSGELHVIIPSLLKSFEYINLYLFSFIVIIYFLFFSAIYKRNKILAGKIAIAVILLMSAIFPDIPKQNNWVKSIANKISLTNDEKPVNLYVERGYNFPVYSILFYLPSGSRFIIVDKEKIIFDQNENVSSFCYLREDYIDEKLNNKIIKLENGIIIPCRFIK